MRIETTYKFDKVTWTGHQYGDCQGCGKRFVRRQRTFVQTVSPFNRDKETGRPKTYAQIQKEVTAQARAWGAQQPWCTNCEGGEKWKIWKAEQAVKDAAA